MRIALMKIDLKTKNESEVIEMENKADVPLWFSILSLFFAGAMLMYQGFVGEDETYVKGFIFFLGGGFLFLSFTLIYFFKRGDFTKEN